MNVAEDTDDGDTVGTVCVPCNVVREDLSVGEEILACEFIGVFEMIFWDKNSEDDGINVLIVVGLPLLSVVVMWDTNTDVGVPFDVMTVVWSLSPASLPLLLPLLLPLWLPLLLPPLLLLLLPPLLPLLLPLDGNASVVAMVVGLPLLSVVVMCEIMSV